MDDQYVADLQAQGKANDTAALTKTLTAMKKWLQTDSSAVHQLNDHGWLQEEVLKLKDHESKEVARAAMEVGRKIYRVDEGRMVGGGGGGHGPVEEGSDHDNDDDSSGSDQGSEPTTSGIKMPPGYVPPAGGSDLGSSSCDDDGHDITGLKGPGAA